MPRSTHSKRASETSPVAPETVGVQNVSTATADTATDTEDTVRELPFTVAITDAPPDMRRHRSPAGRKRIPSPFEDKLPPLKGKGWKSQPHDGKVEPFDIADDGTPKFNTLSTPPKGEDGKYLDVIPSVANSNAKYILRELQKAVKYLNTPKEKGGEELNLGLDVYVTATDVQFNIREKQKRVTFNSDDEVTDDGGEVTDGETADFGDDEEDFDSDSSGDE